jgi:methyl-accepting chemotaxis protein
VKVTVHDKKIVPLARRLRLGFGVPIVMLLALSFVSYQRVVASAAGAAWVRHTHEVMERLAGVLAATQDVETGYRGFVLTGDDRFSRPTRTGARRRRRIWRRSWC